MTAPAYSSFTQWFSEGRLSYVHSMKSPGGVLNLFKAAYGPGICPILPCWISSCIKIFSVVIG